MTAKDWLSRAFTLDKEIAALQQSRQYAFARATSRTSHVRRAFVAPTAADRGDGDMVRYVELGEAIDARLEKLAAVRVEILAAINSLDDGVYRTVLIERYINLKDWYTIADDMYYSLRTVRRHHTIALERVAELVNPSSCGEPSTAPCFRSARQF